MAAGRLVTRARTEHSRDLTDDLVALEEPAAGMLRPESSTGALESALGTTAIIDAMLDGNPPPVHYVYREMGRTRETAMAGISVSDVARD